MDMVVNCVAYKNGRRIGDITIEAISEVIKEEGAFVWVGLNEPDDRLLQKIQEEFGLHELAVEDARSPHQQPKLEEYGDSLFVVLRTAQLVNGSIQFGETHIFVGKKFLVSVRHGFSSGFAKVRERCESTPKRLTGGPGYALYALIDFVVDNYRPVTDHFQQQLEQLETEIFKGQFNRVELEKLYDLKGELLLLRNAASPLLDVCNQLMRFHTEIIPKDVRLYFRDIYDHVRRVIERTDNMREMLTTAMQVNIAMTTVGQNEVVKKLAGWGAILAIPTMVFSWYGMNFKHMPELNWILGYPLVLIGVIGGCVLLRRRLKRIGWL